MAARDLRAQSGFELDAKVRSDVMNGVPVPVYDRDGNPAWEIDPFLVSQFRDAEHAAANCFDDWPYKHSEDGSRIQVVRFEQVPAALTIRALQSLLPSVWADKREIDQRISGGVQVIGAKPRELKRLPDAEVEPGEDPARAVARRVAALTAPDIVEQAEPVQIVEVVETAQETAEPASASVAPPQGQEPTATEPADRVLADLRRALAKASPSVRPILERKIAERERTSPEQLLEDRIAKRTAEIIAAQRAVERSPMVPPTLYEADPPEKTGNGEAV
jgi:hypothetical protein